MNFSERNGYIQSIIQKESMNDALKNCLHNCIQALFDKIDKRSVSYNSSHPFFGEILNNFYKEKIEPAMHSVLQRKEILEKFSSLKWHRIHDFLEFIYGLLKTPPHFLPFVPSHFADEFKDECNKILTRENSAYRFVNEKICPIINESEIQAIEDASSSSKTNVAKHMNKAVKQFAKGDWENTINESMKAVEALLKPLSKEEDKTLGETINIIKKSLKNSTHHNSSWHHTSFLEGWSRFYGFSSDQTRHHLPPNSPEIEISEQLARFILIFASASINLIEADLKQEFAKTVTSPQRDCIEK